MSAGVARKVLVQAAYAIGKAEPVSVTVNTFGTAKVPLSDAEIAARITEVAPLRPYDIEKRLNLRQPIYEETAAYGHMGRTPQTVTKRFRDLDDRSKFIECEVRLFPWEELDLVEPFRKVFGVK